MTTKIADIRKSYVNGRFVQGQGPPLVVENPATEETVAEVETLTLPQMEEAVLARASRLRQRDLERAAA